MKVSVDNELCEAHAQCNLVDSELFTIDDEGYSDIGHGKPVPAGKENVAEQGVDVCPVMALRTEN